jgi:hypothetical protein
MNTVSTSTIPALVSGSSTDSATSRKRSMLLGSAGSTRTGATSGAGGGAVSWTAAFSCSASACRSRSRVTLSTVSWMVVIAPPLLLRAASLVRISREYLGISAASWLNWLVSTYPKLPTTPSVKINSSATPTNLGRPARSSALAGGVSTNESSVARAIGIRTASARDSIATTRAPVAR